MHKTPKVSNQNTNPSVPLTPRVRTTQQTGTALHPNVTTRSPRSAAKKRADSVNSATDPFSSAASRRSSYVERPPSAAGSMISIRNEGSISNNASPRSARPSLENSSGRQSSPMFFRVDDIKPNKAPLTPRLSTSQPQTPQAPKFLHADAVHSSSSSTGSGPSLISPRISSAASTPTSAPLSPIITPPLTSPSIRNHVKFVYANGTEEVLPPRRKAGSSDNSSTPPSSTVAFPPGMNLPFVSSTPTKPALTTSQSSLSLMTSMSPSTFPRSANNPNHSRGTSFDAKVRHGRALSVGASSSGPEILRASDPVHSPISEGPPNQSDAPKKSQDDPSPPTAPITMTFQMREELAANARKERKLLDLEISNTSLLAINRTLERQMRRQNSELRRYRRLARSGRMAAKKSAELASSPSTHRRRSSSVSTAITLDTLLGEDDSAEEANSVSENDEEDDEEDEEERDHDIEEEEMDEDNGDHDSQDEDDDDSTASEGEGGPGGVDADGNSIPKAKKTRQSKDPYNKTKRSLITDRKAVLDISKHQELLDASVKTNASLKRCTLVIEQLILEAKKAIEYKVAPSDVKLGGRILTGDADDDDDVYDGNETEIEALMTETEAEDSQTDRSGGGSRGYEEYGYDTETDQGERSGYGTSDNYTTETEDEAEKGKGGYFGATNQFE